MIYCLLVMSSPTSGLCNRTAAEFADSVIAQGHRLCRVFFLDAGTYAGKDGTVFAQDEANPLHAWVQLAEKQQVELTLCISSALRRGLLDDTEAQRYEQIGATIHPAFTVSGLGQLIDASANCDRLITFGG